MIRKKTQIDVGEMNSLLEPLENKGLWFKKREIIFTEKARKN